jgi:hypothetical protein
VPIIGGTFKDAAASRSAAALPAAGSQLIRDDGLTEADARPTSDG